MNLTFKNILTLSIMAVGLISTGCSGNTKKTAGTVAGSAMAVRDTMKIVLDTDMLDSVKIIFTDTDVTAGPVAKSDIRKMADALSYAEYDTHWNDSGIMVKMVAPDYTLLVYGSDLTEGPDYMMVWKEGGRLKSHGKWFTLEAPYLSQLYTVIDSYIPKK